jgi:hypothetical protein
MPLGIKPSTSIERRLLFVETLLNGTDKVSKISDNSVLSGIAGGVAKLAGKAEKDIVIAVSQLFPDAAFETQLDQAAANYGIAPRFAALGSSVYVRLVAQSGTVYTANTHIFSSNSGVSFELESDFTVGSLGFAYVKVRSTSAGSSTNVESLSIASVSPKPVGHISVVNEYMATGGRDDESDETFRIRIKEGSNILARGTISMLEQTFMNINPKVLRVFNQGISQDGKVSLVIATQNGADLTDSELNILLTGSAKFFSLTEQRFYGTSFYGVKLSNATYHSVDISFRADLDASYDSDQIRIAIQTNISKYLDFRFFDPITSQVEWDNLLEIVKNTAGVKYVPDQYFYPRADITVDSTHLPRVRSFLMLNLDGQVISNHKGTLSPIYYPNAIDDSYYKTVLSNTL